MQRKVGKMLYNRAAAYLAAYLCHSALFPSFAIPALHILYQREHSPPILHQTGENGAEKGNRKAEEGGHQSQPR